MTTSQNIQFKDPQRATAWLEAALKKEYEKDKQCPILSDAVPGYETAQGSAYVVAGYFLIEESFKVILHLRNKQVPTKHSLTVLFDSFEDTDKDVLREYYSDYRATVGGNMANFPFKTLDEFLKNLDGDRNERRTDHIGSFDWRYFPIEEHRSQEMPLVSIDYLHEVANGCVHIAQWIYYGDFAPLNYTHSQRMFWSRMEKYRAWLHSGGWDGLTDSREILWGPDYRDRYDQVLCERDGRLTFLFERWPENSPVKIIDRRTDWKHTM